MPKLIVSMPDGSQASHELSEELMSVGRVQDNVIQIEDASVSSHHAEISFSGGLHFLRDLGSTNGTFLNGHPFTEGPLHDGDQVRFGQIDGLFASDNPANARPLPKAEHLTASVAHSSALPGDFSNASPFKTKSRKKDPIATAILGFACFAVLVFLGAVISIFSLQPPH